MKNLKKAVKRLVVIIFIPIVLLMSYSCTPEDFDGEGNCKPEIQNTVDDNKPINPEDDED